MSTLTLAAPASTQDAELGAQLTAQYHRAQDAEREILLFGAMLVHLEERVLTARTRSPGHAWNKGTGLLDWLSTHAPEVNYKTAQRHKKLVLAARQALEIDTGTDLQRLLTAPADDLTRTERKTQQLVFDFFDGKSHREILGYDVRVPVEKMKPKGGDLRGPGPRPKRTKIQIETDELLAASNAWKIRALGIPEIGHPGELHVAVERNLIQFLTDAELSQLISDARDLAAAATKEAAARKEAAAPRRK